MPKGNDSGFKFLIRDRLPRGLQVPLWGDRERWGLVINEEDPCWKEWEKSYLDFYSANRREGIGTAINDAGYRIMSDFDMSGMRILEIGGGDIRHISFWKGLPAEYLLADVQADMINKAQARLETAHVPHRSIHLRRGESLPLDDNSAVDVVVSFYSLEHIHPLPPYLAEIKRVLRPGGVLIGAIPAEGGVAWGSGRMLTSRRWLKNNTTIDPDKIICGEHPNFSDHILIELDQRFYRQQISLLPLPWLPLLDANLILRFVYRNQC